MMLTMCVVWILGKTTIDEEDEELARAVAASLEQSKEVAGESDATDDMAEPEEEDVPSINIKLDYPPLPEEPTGSRDLLCRVAIRLPDGRRIQRNFLHTDPIKVTQPKSILPVLFYATRTDILSVPTLQLLWSFCSPNLEDGEKRSFHFVKPIPGASQTLEFGSDLTFKEAGLANSMINLLWD
jgi:UBX domain-containing protein 7